MLLESELSEDTLIEIEVIPGYFYPNFITSCIWSKGSSDTWPHMVSSAHSREEDLLIVMCSVKTNLIVRVVWYFYKDKINVDYENTIVNNTIQVGATPLYLSKLYIRLRRRKHLLGNYSCTVENKKYNKNIKQSHVPKHVLYHALIGADWLKPQSVRADWLKPQYVHHYEHELLQIVDIYIEGQYEVRNSQNDMHIIRVYCIIQTLFITESK